MQYRMYKHKMNNARCREKLFYFLGFWSLCLSAHLPPGIPVNSEVDVDFNGEKLISLKAAVQIPDANEKGGQLMWPILIPENENTTDLEVETAYVIVRGLYHEYAEDIRIRLLHDNRASNLVNQRGGNRKYGEPTQRNYWDLADLVQKRTHKKQNDVLYGVGMDYIFTDITGQNLASGMPGEQSSSMDGNYTAAWRATDGDIFYSGVATHTDKNPWYQVDLGANKDIQTVVLWTPDPENAINEVQVVTTKGLVTLGGHFRLSLTHNGVTATTEPINHNAVGSIKEEYDNDKLGIGNGESMEAKIQSLENVGLVKVSRSEPDRTGGYAWTITFLTERADLNEMFVAENNLTSGPLRIPEDQVASITVGTEQEGTRNTFYNVDMRFGEVLVSNVPFGNASLTEARDLAVANKVFEISYRQRQINVPLPTGTKGRYVRVTLRQTSYLSLAEVLVFSEKLFSVEIFTGGTPIPGGVYAPENALGDTFRGSKLAGDWLLSINDYNIQTVGNEHNSHRRLQLNGKGALSDWVLHVIPKNSNETLVYYVDMTATVLTLPKFGKLYIAAAYEKGELIEAVKGQEIFVAPCYNDCKHKFGVGNVLTTDTRGSIAETNKLLNDRQVVYVPNTDFLGDDSFEYRINTGTVPEPTIGTVTIHVKKCRINCDIEIFGRKPAVEEHLRSPWTSPKTDLYPPDKFGEDGIIWENPYCDHPPCNVIV